jgi:hypothetical protein
MQNIQVGLLERELSPFRRHNQNMFGGFISVHGFNKHARLGGGLLRNEEPKCTKKIQRLHE